MTKFNEQPKNINEGGINKKAVEMYLDDSKAGEFAEREKNDKEWHGNVSRVIDSIVEEAFKDKNINIANLGAGANPQKYEKTLEKIAQGSHMDWVDISPKMLEVAEKEIETVNENLKQNINFIESNFSKYFENKENDSLDVIVMQYAINYIDNLQDFFKQVSQKLKKEGMFVANLGTKILENDAEASFLVNGKEITEKTKLHEGDTYTINFLNPDGSIFASTQKKYFSNEELTAVAKQFELTPLIEKVNGVNMIIMKK